MKQEADTKRPHFPEGKQIDHFTVFKFIGSGGYGDIYGVFDQTNDDELCALKVEYFSSPKKGLDEELDIMKKMQGSPCFPKLISFGKQEDFKYLVMELFGPSLSAMRRILPRRKYTLYTTHRLAIDMLHAIKEFHKRGFIHRDIKPGNFLIRSRTNYPIALIDFGLSQSFINEKTHQHVSPSRDAGFTGTCRYASPNAHSEKQLSRRDDLYSWFYSILELVDGKVPWPGSRDRDLTIQMKASMKVQELCQSLTPEFIEIYNYITTIKFKDKPNYKWIKEKIEVSLVHLDIHEQKYDWELIDDAKVEDISLIPLEAENQGSPNYDFSATTNNSQSDVGCACTIF